MSFLFSCSFLIVVVCVFLYGFNTFFRIGLRCRNAFWPCVYVVKTLYDDFALITIYLRMNIDINEQFASNKRQRICTMHVLAVHHPKRPIDSHSSHSNEGLATRVLVYCLISRHLHPKYCYGDITSSTCIFVTLNCFPLNALTFNFLCISETY